MTHEKAEAATSESPRSVSPAASEGRKSRGGDTKPKGKSKAKAKAGAAAAMALGVLSSMAQGIEGAINLPNTVSN